MTLRVTPHLDPTVQLYMGRAGFVFRYWSREIVLFKVFSGSIHEWWMGYHSKYSFQCLGGPPAGLM